MNSCRNAIVALLFSFCAYGQDAPLTKDAIIQMAKAGLPEDAIIGKIGSQPNPPKFSTADFIEMRSAGVSDGVMRALAIRINAAFHPAVGSGFEYRLRSPSRQLDVTHATVNVGQEADGYWMEDRNSVRIGNNVTNVVTKELMAGEPAQPKRRIVQVAGLNPVEAPVGGASRGGGIALVLLNALVVALDAVQTDAAQRQIQQASRPIRGDAGKLQYASRESTQIQLPASAVSPAHPDPGAPANGPVVPAPAPTATTGGRPANVVRVGTESVTVPAGTFECDHYAGDSNSGHIDFWISPGVGLSGLVKLSSGDDFSMELQKVFEHETSQIKDLPRKKK
jgi:hypothetical protein